MSNNKTNNSSASTEEFNEKVDGFFNENPKTKQVFTTSDGFLFTNVKFANDHANTLGEEPAKCHKNPTHIEVETEEETETDE